jgi:uncharacterized protein with von Willebrand factor type A (vWA) domain
MTTAPQDEGFDVAALERRYAFLDECPEQFLDEIVTLPIGTLPERVRGIQVWREALLDGRLPSTDQWPSSLIAEPARLALESLGILRFCKGQPELVDAVLHDVIRSFTRRAELVRSEVAKRLRELEHLERERLEREERDGNRLRATKARLDERVIERLRQQAEHEVAEHDAEADRELSTTWSERVRAWAAIADVFGDLGALSGRGWDMSIGVLKHVGWHDVLRLRTLVEQLPQLREIVQSLGRLHATTETAEPVADTLFVPMRRLEEERRELWTPHVPAETRGLERSGEIARILPVEAINLGHPKLRYLWHARRAERALLTYRVEGLEIERTLIERETTKSVEQQRQRPQRGPIIAVVDTSGSMHGVPEHVAKALVLEALRTAHAERRRCFVYAYSGPNQVIEHELELTADGLGRLLAFLLMSFGGGSDELAVMTRVLRRLEDSGWCKADVVFVSDGEWPEPTSLAPLITAARANGTRFHGVQIGNRGRTGLHAICDPVHVFQDWATAGGW